MHSKTENLWNFWLVRVSSALCLGMALYWEAVQWPLALSKTVQKQHHSILDCLSKYHEYCLAFMFSATWTRACASQVPGISVKKVFYRNIASAIGIACVDYFSFSAIFMDMFVILSRFNMLTKKFLSKYMFKKISVGVSPDSWVRQWVRVHKARVRVRVHQARVRVHQAWVRVHWTRVRVRVQVRESNRSQSESGLSPDSTHESNNRKVLTCNHFCWTWNW